MIDYSEFRRTIEGLIADGVEGIPVIYENTKSEEVKYEHVEVFDTDTNSIPTSMGGTDRIIEGVLLIKIFTKVGTGTERARSVASQICSVFSDYIDDTDSVMFTGQAELASVGRVENSGLYQHNLSIPYMYNYGG